MNEFNNYYCQHNIPAISCSICSCTRVQTKQYNQFDTQIVRYEVQIQAYKELIKAQEEKIISLSFDLEYAKRTIENLTVEEPKKEEYYDEDTFDVQYLYLYNDSKNGIMRFRPTLLIEPLDWVYMGKVRLEK